MDKKTKNFKKIAIILIVIILISFSFPLSKSYGAFTGILTKPVCALFVNTLDTLNFLLASFTVPPGTNINTMMTTLQDDSGNFSVKFSEKDTLNGIDALRQILMSPEKIFAGQVTLLDANIFDAPVSNQSLQDVLENGDQSLASALKKTVSNIYVWLRNICAVILLCLLIYTGIRILITAASPYDQAKWKKALLDWIKALCLLMFMHFIMVGIFYISDLLVDAMSRSFQGGSLTATIRWAFTNTSWFDGSTAILLTIMYAYITYLTIVFFIAYFKRFVWVVILTVISPVVATSYALGNSQTKIFNQWIKEYIFTVLLQAFHMLIFYILVGIPLGNLGSNTQNTGIVNVFLNQFDPTNNTSVMVSIYVLIAISMIRPAEKFFMHLFGFDSSAVAKQGSSESGVKTIKAIEKVVVDTAKLAAGVVTGGAALAAGGAGMAASAASKGVGAASSNGQGVLNGLNQGQEALNEGQDTFNNDLLPGEDLAGERKAYDALTEEGLDPESGWTEDDYRAHMEMGKELSEREKAFADKNNSLSDASALKEAAEELKQAATVLKDGKGENKDDEAGNLDKIEQVDISDAEFDNVLDDKSKGNKLMDRLKNSGAYSILTSPNNKENLNNAMAGLNELRDSMYLDGAPGEWKNGPLGYDASKERLNNEKKEKLDAFVNNKNNINYMKQEHGLTDKEAKARLEAAGPYVNRGITNVEMIDRMIGTEERTGKNPSATIMSYAKSERVIQNKNNVNTVAQIIARSTGEKVSSPQVQEKAKEVMQQSRPYIEAGQKDPEILHRLVHLEEKLKNANMAPGVRSADKVMRMDKYIDKAVKNGVKKIDLTSGKNVSEGVKQLESAMNKELRDRISRK